MLSCRYQMFWPFCPSSMGTVFLSRLRVNVMLQFLVLIALFGVLPSSAEVNGVNARYSAREAVVLPGQCNNVQAMANFDVERYQGQWFEIESYLNGYQDGDCISGEYEATSSNVLRFRSTEVYRGTDYMVEGAATTSDGTGRFVVSLASDSTDDVISFSVTEYSILDTDYESYSLAYSCVNLDSSTKRVYSWKLSRTKELTESGREAINAIINQVEDLDNAYYRIKDHSEWACYVYPPVVPGQVVVLDGQCPTDIPVVQNFDINRYQGLWYDIESYYTSAQTGSCVDADFTPSGNGFTIESTQIMRQTVQTNLGIATLASNDGSARFEISYSGIADDGAISFDRTEYWVLATDFDSYSLIYSCSNLTPTTKSVFAWKQSRSRELSSSAREQIANVMENILELDDRFFFAISHSYEDCFYYPELVSGQPVILRGQCQDVPAVQNFNISNFLGTWNEIASYPTGAEGVCVSYDISQAGSGYSISRSRALDGQIVTTDGSIEWAGDEGRFTVTFNVGGIDLAFPFLVLSTDYENYALGYSCINLDSERKEVFSWKLGKSRTLTADSLNAIDAAVESILALDERYFQTVDQSGASCLVPFFPVEHSGNEVIFTGRCEDTLVPAMQNFNSLRFEGVWYDIESYFNSAQTGECGEVEYSLASQGVLNLSNKQVVSGQQVVQSGTATQISNDGSARFTVSLSSTSEDSVVSLVEGEYVIVDTDYNSYALLYSCTNLPNNQRKIYSWKQSRSRSLTNSAQNAINNLIQQVDVLDNAYFNAKDHSDSACLVVDIPLGTEVIFPGQCDQNIPVVQNIDLERYAGTWYDIEMYYNSAQRGECTAAQYVFTSSGILDFNNTQVLDGVPTYQTGVATLISTDGSAKFDVVLANTDDDSVITFARDEYWVLATDYDSYSLVYACTNLPDNTRRVYSWKQSRTRQLTNEADQAINAIIQEVDVLRNSLFEVKDHSNEACLIVTPTPPTPDVPATEAIFPGQCDEDIPVVQNIDLERYAGTWYDIEMYYNSAQRGQCTAAEYVFESPDTLNFNNTQVLNGRPTYQTGIATLISTDGSAKFNVVLANTDEDAIISFTRSEYWVLATDYDSYSLLYSCVNLPDNTKRVYSWKQSRTRQLTNSAQQAIATVVQQIDVLQDSLFEVKDHSDDACLIVEPLPLPPLGTEAIFPGTCQDNIPVVQNIDLARYQGTWYDIEMYYNSAQRGQCNAAQYVFTTAGSLSFNNTQVLNGVPTYQTGTATLSSTDGSAKFNVALANTDEDSVISFTRVEYWILATDYDSYSLVYSCSNLPDNTRRVYSWKQSRTQELTDTAQQEINAIVQQVDVLMDEVFEVKDHSDQACLIVEPPPDISLGTEAIFPGQCDDNIPVVQNIDLARYAGTWYDIEMYYNSAQRGQCTAAQYVLASSGTLDFNNTQVLNGIPTFQTGAATLISTDGSARFDVLLANSDEDSIITFTRAEYWVLATDYDSYSLLYSCSNLPDNTRRVYSWKQSRTRQLTDSAQQAIAAVVQQVDVLFDNLFEAKDHSDEACLIDQPIVIPDGPLGTEAIFPGQCDENIPVVQNIDLQRYQGTWYDIELYYNSAQRGECSDSIYTLGSQGVLNFENTQVINGTATTQTGFATLVSTDGSAKFEVSLAATDEDSVISFARVEYWILATDYDTYSLIYSCSNLPDNTRRVYSWKQSRTRELSESARLAIDEAIAPIDVLLNQLYEVKDHSEEACRVFEPVYSNEVILPGQCADEVPAVLQNYDPVRYLGAWYDVESYPDFFDGGTCNTREYGLTSNGLISLQNSKIVNGSQVLATGSANFVGNDGSGRLIATYYYDGPDGTVASISFQYWILDTDYDSYSFAYACQNVDANSKKIYSWKLSRTPELTPAANTAINAIVSQYSMLNQDYYIDRDHSDEACRVFEQVDTNEVVLPGQCADEVPAVLQNYDPIRYLGAWYDVESYPDFFAGGTCNTREYGLTSNGLISLQNSKIVNGTQILATGSANFVGNDGSGRLIATYYYDGPDGTVGSISFEYWILDTDYDSYSFAYACQNVDADSKKIYSWKLSRTPELTPAANTAINAIVSQYSMLNQDYYIDRDHSDEACFFYPDPVPGEPVTLNGQCDDNIPVVGNFDINRYSGPWYNIESYNLNFLDGNCGEFNHVISSIDSYSVSINQVINQTLNTVSASMISRDGNGRFDVIYSTTSDTVISFGFSPFYIIDTDYNSYSLGYSCVNVSPTQKQIYSWKLSRTRELTESANNAINALVSEIRDLDDRFYNVRDHSEDGCFFMPEVNPNQVTIFPGQCSNDIATVANFDTNRFQGIWNEISAYPTLAIDGGCVHYEFTAQSGNNLGLTIFQTDRGDAILNNGNLTSSGNDGKFTATVNLGGSASSTFPLWILDTDYDAYAIAYSCVNLPDNQKSVYSWKLSRNKALSIDGIVAINQVISSVNVLDERFFVESDQSGDACLVLPNLGPNEPVIMSGQCSSNVPVVNNFDLQRFAGGWYTIENYYNGFIDGDCGEVTFNVNADGSIRIVKTTVQNQETITANFIASVVDNTGDAKLDVTFDNTNDDGVINFVSTQVWILATDYDSYSLAYACENLTPTTKQVFSWKLSRTRQLSSNASNEINNVINQVVALSDRFFYSHEHSGAFCYPEPEIIPGDTIVFRGQCNPNVPVVQNFDAARYMGLWFDIESYPERFQFGTCPTATYTLNPAGFVEVYNTQVTNRTLDEIYGTAVVVSDDGSAKLDVTFPVFGTDFNIVSPYWVLATDYDNYALVYSCINLSNDSYQVTSWKLSRETTLSAASAAAIDSVTEYVAVLNNNYYDVRGHSESDCLYYPESDGGPVILRGTCLPLNGVSNFNIDAFSGQWFEIARFPSDQQTGECASTEITTNSSYVNIDTTFVQQENVISISGIANLESVGDGTFDVAFTYPNQIREFLTVTVLDTDYSSYALLYSCKNLGGTPLRKQILSWKLSTSKTGLTALAEQNINAIVEATDDLHAPFYKESDQSGSACIYYPDFGLDDNAIILPGECSDNIQAVPNFNVAGYLGRWYEISSFPVPSQDQNAQCSRADYTLNNNVVDVFNTLVVNETLDVQTGVASVASADGSGVLDVTFVLSNGEVVNANYYVLSTDYNNYALVYSCRNVENGNRQVSSWILSRQKTLANQYYNIINPVIASTEGLREDYYRPTSQSDEDCFYIPTLDPSAAVIFNGQCEVVTGVAGFDIARYAGWWHEIEAYPTGENINGTCVSSRIQSSGNQYLAIDTTVFGLASDVTTSTLTVGSNGRLTRTRNGVSTDVWVLATDYNLYSLLYSCENIDSDRRRVWSGIHSKQRSISNIANLAVQSTIATNDVLINDLYVPVDQSDQACFHYPELDGNRVIIPGQCDNNIPVVQNFNAVAYQGTWYQIEKYRQPWESGTCVGARYTLDEQTGVVDVVNWEVIDGVLDTIEGTAVVISTDGSAKLLVTLPVVGTTQTTTYELYVLATDYENYSLAYSCENVNEYERAIGAWKLSRTRQMPASGSAVINTVIAQREELHQPYFEVTVQNEDCEEPSSAHLVTGSLLLMIACAFLQRFL